MNATVRRAGWMLLPLLLALLALLPGRAFAQGPPARPIGEAPVVER